MTALATPVANPPDEYTWVGLIPPDDQEADTAQWITRETLLAGFDNTLRPVNERVLKSWEAKGILPRPLVRWKDGRPHTWYPSGLAESAIHTLLNLKEQGHSLARVRLILQDHIELMIRSGKRKDPTARDRWDAALNRIADELAVFEDTYHDLTGHRLAHVIMKATDDAGESFTVKYPWPAWRR